ncbi:unnamed protein product [Durusdinium trenchii]|uniref:Sperm-associated antigen 6 n=2 Tax=Durusdinium trenchii TaxID=1381693 RepID=A0ABP0R3B4_9DINO
MTAAVPMFDQGWNVPVFAIYPMVPVPAINLVGIVATFQSWEDEGSRMREAMGEMPVHFSFCEKPRWKILCYGDSLTAGFFAGGAKFDPYGRSMAEVLANGGIEAQVSVCGHSGCTTAEMLRSAESELVDVARCRGVGLSKILEDQNYDLVIIMSGTNDLGRGTPLDVIVEDLVELHALCHRQGVCTMALAPAPAPGYCLAQEMQRQYISTRLSARLGAEPRVVASIDPQDFLSPADASLWEMDGLHFAPRGSQVLGQSLAILVAQLAGASTAEAQ